MLGLARVPVCEKAEWFGLSQRRRGRRRAKGYCSSIVLSVELSVVVYGLATPLRCRARFEKSPTHFIGKWLLLELTNAKSIISNSRRFFSSITLPNLVSNRKDTRINKAFYT
jgi:hypothetical protein